MPIIILLVLLLCGSAVSAKELYLDDFSSYVDNAAINQTWSGYAPDRVSILDADGIKAGRLQPELDAANPWKVYFDMTFSEPLDLSEFTRIEMRLRSDSPGSISSLPIYFQSADGGWYCMPTTSTEGNWTTQTIAKTFFPWGGCNTDPNGWKNIVQMRIRVQPLETKVVNLDIDFIKFRDDAPILEEMGKIGRFENYNEALASIEASAVGHPNQPEIASRLKDVKEIHNRLASKLDISTPVDLKKFELGKKLMSEAWALSQKADPTEKMRGVFSHYGDGILMQDNTIMPWEEALPVMKEQGYNAIFPNVLWSGVAYYPSAVVPEHVTVQAGADHMSDLIRLGKENNLEVHAWKVMFMFAEGWLAPMDVVQPFKDQNRLQVDELGKQQNMLTLCDPVNIDYEVAAINELITKYPVDGVMLDYIRYHDSSEYQVDFHEKCRPLFEAFHGASVTNWPQDVVRGGALAQQYMAWKRSMVTDVVKKIHTSVKALRPEVVLSAAVYSDPNNAYNNVAQDWGLWAQQGYMDLLIPMNYTQNRSNFKSTLEAGQKAVAGTNVPLYSALTAYTDDWKDHIPLDKMVDQILIHRESGEKGYTIFSYAEQFKSYNMPYVARGLNGMTNVALPIVPDSDQDGLNDDRELIFDTDPNNADTDGDGISDGDEVSFGTDPLDPVDPLMAPIWNSETIYDFEDIVLHNRALWSAKWWTQNEEPKKSEWGSWKYLSDLDDLDNDGLTNKEEVKLKTDYRNADTDGDGYSDGTEVQQGTDPLSAASFPTVPNNWDATVRYEKGDTVLHNGKQWNARWVSINEEPGSSEWTAWIVLQ